MASLDDIVSEILDLRQRRVSINRDAYLQRYPELARALAEFMNDLDLFDAMMDSPYRAKCIELLGGEPTVPVPLPQLQDTPPGGFRIIRELRRGAEGVVYEAIQRSTGRTVALKMLYRYSSPQGEHEAQLVARLRHPNVVTVYDAGVYRGRPYWAMEMVEGPPMDRYVAQQKLDLRSKLRLFVKICAGVAHAHQRSIIHRDLKPANIVIDRDGEPRVLDFGLAKQAEPPPRRNGSRAAAEYGGTLAYSSPEQLAGEDEDIDVRSDVYSLGVILFELLTDELPYELPNNPQAARAMITREEPPRPSSRRRGLNDDLDRIVLKAIALNPDRRYPTVDALAEEVEQYLEGKPLTQKLDQPVYVARKMMARHPGLVAAVVIGIVSVGLLGAVTWSWLHERNVAVATLNRRFEQVRQRDLESLNAYQEAMAAADRVRQAQLLDPEQAADYLRRYRLPSLDPQEVLGPVVQKIPADALAAVGKQPHDVDSDWVASLAGVDEDLDALAAQLALEHFRFILTEGNVTALGWDHVPVGDATGLCAVYVNRAYRRHSDGDVEGAADDIRAAMRLADDVGEGVLPSHKASAYQCHLQNLRFLAAALSDVIGTDDALPYLELARSYPEPPPATPSLRPVSLGLYELVDVALVTNSDGSDERVDLRRLDAFLNDSLTALGALTEENADMQLTPTDAFGLIDKYILCASDWDELDSFEIQTQIESLDEEIAAERQGNPFLWLVSVPGPEYLARLEVLSLRQTLRLLDHVERYRMSHGDWPTTLADALPLDGVDEMIDPRTGRAFEYDLHAGMPRLRSLRTTAQAGEVDDGAAEFSTYFPVSVTDLDRPQSAPNGAESDTTPLGG